MKLRDKILFRCLLWRLPIPIPSTWMRQHFWISEFKFCKLSVSIFTATNYKKVSWFRSKYAKNHQKNVLWLLLKDHLWFFDFMKDIKDYFSFIKVYFHKNYIKSDNLIRGKLKVWSWDSDIRYRKFKFQHFELKKEKLIFRIHGHPFFTKRHPNKANLGSKKALLYYFKDFCLHLLSWIFANSDVLLKVHLKTC